MPIEKLPTAAAAGSCSGKRARDGPHALTNTGRGYEVAGIYTYGDKSEEYCAARIPVRRDEAGRKAAWRALEASAPLLGGERRVKFMFLPAGEDPDSLVKTEGAEGFLRRLQAAMPFSEWRQTGNPFSR